MIEPSERILIGRRRLEEVAGLSILDDLQWDQGSKCFFIHISIDIESYSPLVPPRTEWYVTIDSNYPYGEIEIYPSASNSINCTFPHQSNNYKVTKNGLWRTGKLCVEFNSQSLGIHAFDKSPLTVEDRLFWYGERAVMWVRSAANNALLSSGDFFELPDYSPKKFELFAYIEDAVSFMQWEDSSVQIGYAIIREKKNSAGFPISLVTAFLSKDNETLFRPYWGNPSFVNENVSDEQLAIWIKLSKPLSVNHWQAPMTFDELQKACLAQGVNFFDSIKQFASKMRDGLSHIILFGFPVPQKVDDSPDEIVWQAMRLPTLSCEHTVNQRFQSGKKKRPSGRELGVPCGFRVGETGWWRNDMQTVLCPSKELTWIESENWSSHYVLARGQYSRELCKRKIAVIGSGSLGSTLSELLVRGGASQLCCIDGDIVSQGNLCRHNLTIQDLGHCKSSALAKRLSSISPHAIISSSDNFFYLTPSNSSVPDLSEFDTIIDTTGSDQVLEMLAQIADGKKIIFSASVGLGAKRLYLCMFKKKNPLLANFYELISPYFVEDQKECGVSFPDLPREGIGCWHPLFPATASDMWMAAGVTQKALESFIDLREYQSLAIVYEANTCERLFTGFNPVEVKYDCL